VKWNITPKLLFSSAVYELNRNQPADFPFRTRRRAPAWPSRTAPPRCAAFEASLNGYITDLWQSQLGYAYTPTPELPRTLRPQAWTARRSLPAIVFSWCRIQSVRVVEQIPVHPDVERCARHHLFSAIPLQRATTRSGLPGFVRFDAAIYAKIDETWSAQLNIENIFNKGYWAIGGRR